jgi:rhamnosyltransferase
MTAASVCGVVVTYHPEPDALDNVRAMVAECGRVIVVDNASPSAAQAQLAAVPGVELIALPENQGVATALNVGAGRAMEHGFGWVVTFDQDSTPEPGMVAAFCDARERNPQAAIVAPRIFEGGPHGPRYRWVRANPRSRWLFQRAECEDVDLAAVTMVVTSGSMVELQTWKALGGFDETLFIDYVDIDYCLKAVRAGRSIVVAARARLLHRLGARKEAWLFGKDFRPTWHPAFRHYFMARNRVHVWRRHAWAVPHWAVFDLSFAAYNAFRILVFEHGKWAKFKALYLGFLDGLRGRSGPCPAARRRVFET